MTPTTDTAPQQVTVLLEPTNRAEIDRERLGLVAAGERDLPDEIVSPQEYAGVGELEARINEYIARVEPVFDEHVSAAHKVWKTACAIRSMFLDGPRALKDRCRKLRGAYEQKEQAARREAERLESERQRQAEIARRNAEAKLLEKQGQKDQAAAVRQQPVYAAPVALPKNVPTVTGVTALKRNWTWRPIGGDRKDPAALKRAAQIVPREYCTLDVGAITAMVKNSKGTVRIPGIEIFEEKV